MGNTMNRDQGLSTKCASDQRFGSRAPFCFFGVMGRARRLWIVFVYAVRIIPSSLSVLGMSGTGGRGVGASSFQSGLDLRGCHNMDGGFVEIWSRRRDAVIDHSPRALLLFVDRFSCDDGAAAYFISNFSDEQMRTPSWHVQS